MSAFFPAGANCFGDPNGVLSVDALSGACPTTADMITFLNLTTSFTERYYPAYCLNPPSDDGCPYGYCPNPDIAGPLVRISSYLTNLFVAILIFYNPEGLQESFWSQVLTVYSLIITCGISIIQSQLNRVHAILATAIAGSPLSLYIVVYAIRSMWSNNHRLAPAVGAGRIIPRLIVLTALGVWIALTIYILLPTRHFSQTSCDAVVGRGLTRTFFILPIAVLIAIDNVLVQFVVTLPIQLTIIAWFIAILLKRKDIWPPGQRYTFRFWTVWRVVSAEYPFIKFVSIVLIPFVYWCGTIEMAVLVMNDNTFSASFGQVLAMFVAVPPTIACAKLLPRLCRWFIDLSWVRLFTCRRQRRTSSEKGIPLTFDTQKDYAKLDPLSISNDDRGVYDKVPFVYDT